MPESSPTAVASAVGWAALAILVFGIGLAISFSGYWGNDLTKVVPMPASQFVERGEVGRHFRRLTLNDYRMGVWAFSRNAYTLVRHPTRLFQSEPCFPVDNALALHHPVITQGLVALPGYLLTGDPVATTNLLLFATILLGALAVGALRRHPLRPSDFYRVRLHRHDRRDLDVLRRFHVLIRLPRPRRRHALRLRGQLPV